MNCIFICVFNQEQYVDMFFILLESIFIYGNLNNTDILVYTSTPFMNKIQKSELMNDLIKFVINDTYDNIKKSCMARTDIFDLPISTYEKILYLDTDILIKDDIQKIFDVCKEDILYVLEEGIIQREGESYWGNTLFNDDEMQLHKDKSAFTSGILLFNNCEKIKAFFKHTKQFIIDTNIDFVCMDQPYIIYNAFKHNIYDNQVLKNFVVNNDNNIHSNKVIHHFPGGPGVYDHKLKKMHAFLNNLNDYKITTAIFMTKLYIQEHLIPIIANCDELLEGNIFMNHHTCTFTDDYINKQQNISLLVLNKNIKHVMEIGFNSGFSTLLMLLTNPTLQITCFDLGEHKYTIPCYTQIKTLFGNRLNLIIGNSKTILPMIQDKYDLIHIDGGHSTDVVISDIYNSYRLSKHGTILIMDDYNFTNIHDIWNNFITIALLQPLNICLYDTNLQSIKHVLL